MIIRNAKIINPGRGIDTRDIFVDDETGLICSEDKGGDVTDAEGLFCCPGFIDTHIHGSFGSDTSDGSPEAIRTMASRLPEFGVAAFCPTTMTTGIDVIRKAFEATSEVADSQNRGEAQILGIHLEGPFMSPEMAGVQNADCCIPPSRAMAIVDALEADFPGLMKIIDLAPELDGGMEFIRKASGRYVVSLAHSEADYETAMRAFGEGATSVTHILNAMKSFGKRFPGIPAAVCDNGKIYAEIICDGYHIEAPMLRMMFRLIDPDHMIIISDAMRGAGMPDGVYKLADADVEVRGGRTYYGPGGNLAGSVTNLAQEAHRLYSFGIPMDSIIRALTINPLRRLGIKPENIGLGYVRPGFRASFNLMDDEFRLVSSCVDGIIREPNADII